MPGYIAAVLHIFQHPHPAHPQHAPYKMQPINYGAKVQFAMPDDTTTPLTDAEKLTFQQVIGCFLYYARSVDPTMLMALSTLASEQATDTAATAGAMHHILDYCATHPDSEVQFHSSDMVLQVSSDASYLSEPEAHSRTALGTNLWSQQHLANAVVHPVTGKQMEYMALMNDPSLQPLWKRGFSNEAGRLFQGIHDIPGTNTCFFVELTNIPKDRKITYGKMVCYCKPHKKEKERVILTVGGDRLDYSGDVATSTDDVTTFRILINSTLSTKDAAMMMMDIKNYYLGTPLPRYEYMIMLFSRFPEEIVEKYNLKAQAVDGWVYIEIRKGMYGLKHAGLLANQMLQKRLATFGYYPARHTPGLWLHKTSPIAFSLIVDNFSVKYMGKRHDDHLRNALLQSYELTTDWE
jgi:hypothetical protein